jgi:hypothetical protein
MTDLKSVKSGLEARLAELEARAGRIEADLGRTAECRL